MDWRTREIRFLDFNNLTSEEHESLRHILYEKIHKSDCVEFPWDSLETLGLGENLEETDGSSKDKELQTSSDPVSAAEVIVTSVPHNNANQSSSHRVYSSAVNHNSESQTRGIYVSVPLNVEGTGLVQQPMYMVQSPHGQPPLNIIHRAPVTHVTVQSYGPPIGIPRSMGPPFTMMGQGGPPPRFMHPLPGMLPLQQPQLMHAQPLLPQCLPTTTSVLVQVSAADVGAYEVHKLYEKTYERRNKKRRPPGYYQGEVAGNAKNPLSNSNQEPTNLTFGSASQYLEKNRANEDKTEESQSVDMSERTESESYTTVSVESNITLDSQPAVANEQETSDNTPKENSNVIDFEFGFDLPPIRKSSYVGNEFVCELETVVLAEPATLIPEPATMVPEPATPVPEPATPVPEPATSVPKPATLVPEPATVVPEPATQVPEPATPVPEPATLVPEPVHETGMGDGDKAEGLKSDVKLDSEIDTDDTKAAATDTPKVSSWAGLFKRANNQSPGVVVYDNSLVVEFNTEAAPCNNAEQNNSVEGVILGPPASGGSAQNLGRTLLDYNINHKTSSIQPRGLVNRGNWCYINTTLQALLACPPFFNLMKTLPSYPALKRGPSSTPILDSLAAFVSEFHMMPQQKGPKGKRSQDIYPGHPFEPINVYTMLQAIQSNQSFKQGRQEDAEEFLSCVLNGLHEEMLAAMNAADGNKEGEHVTNGYIASDMAAGEEEGETTEADEWQQVGPKNKSVVTRSAKFVKTPISEIFGGQIRSALHKSGLKESATLQPFFTLQLDIQSDKIWSLQDALEGFVTKESVQGLTCSKTKLEIEATRRLTLEELPPVLILHLKCFIYDKSGGCQKVVKRIDYGENLDISRELLSPNVRSKLSHGKRNYKLFAVVYHHGNKAIGGHYTADVYHSGINGWLRMDDSAVKVVSYQQVLKFVSPKVPYILYYRRCDLL